MLVAAIAVVSLTTAMLLLAVIALRRDLEEVRLHSSAPPAPAWPLGVSVGASVDLPALPDTCFLVLVPLIRDAYPTVVSTGYVAARWGYDLVVATLPSDERAPDLEEAVHQFGGQCLEVAHAFFDTLAPKVAPTVVFIRDRRVQEALASPSSPADVAAHFTTAAGPLVTTSSLDLAEAVAK